MDFELRGITKRFPGVVANDGVDLTIRTSEVLALVGENGAGKSTLMNILYGLYHADEGELLIDGRPVRFSSPSDAIAAGIGMVHQHFMLVPPFTVAENVVLGVEPTGRLGKLNMAAARAEVREISVRYGLELDPDAIVEDLPVGIQQRVEIVKVLFRDADIVVFDEPTAVLTPQEIEDFFGIVRSLRDGGRGIVFITHKLKEALAIADRIEVLRRGKVVGHADPRTATQEQLAEMMVGRPVILKVDKAPAQPGEPVLVVEDLVVADDTRPSRRRPREPVGEGRVRSSASPACRGTASPSSSRRSRDWLPWRAGGSRSTGRTSPPPAPVTGTSTAWPTCPRTASAAGSSRRSP